MIIRLRKWELYIGLVIIYWLLFMPGRIKITNFMVNTEPIVQNRVIVIDPGHGGIDGGTSYKGVLEKDLNLEIGLKLKEYIEENSNAKVIMTREEDTALDHYNKYSSSRHERDLRARIDIINQEKADLFISLHIDARSNKNMRGPMVLYYPRHPQNKILARTVQKHLNQLEHPEADFPDHQIKKRRDLYVPKAKKTPGIMVELGFITNHKDRRLLQKDSYQESLVRALYKGLEEYFSGFKFLEPDNI